MDRKKIIIAVTIICVCIGMFELFYFFSTKNQSGNNQGASQNQSSSTVSQVTPQTTSQTNATSQVTPQTNSQTNSSSSGFPQDQSGSQVASKSKTNLLGAASVTVSDPNSNDSLKSAFSSFISDQSSGLKWTEFRDSQNNPVSLGKFSSAVGLNVNSKILALLDPNNYDLFSCGFENGMKTSGLVINVKLVPNYKGNLYQDEVAFIKNWESTILKDTRNVIFPGINFSQKDLEQKVVFKDGKYRYADIVLPDGKKSSLNYAILYDPIVISNSFDCLDKAVNALYTPDMPK